MEGDVVPRGRKKSKEDADSEACCLPEDSEAKSLAKRPRKEQEENTTASHRDLITRMPELVQDKIFGFLGVRDKVQAAQVCSSWRTPVYRPCQWKEVKVGLRSKRLSEETLSSWKERKIRHVAVYDFSVQTKTVNVLHDWSSLASLKIDYPPLPFDVLQSVFCQDFLSLKELHVWVSCEESPFFPCFHDIFQHVPNLESLSLHVDAKECTDLDEPTDLDQTIARDLKGLRHLSLRFPRRPFKYNVETLSHLVSLQSLDFTLMTLSRMDSLNSSCKTLKKLALMGCHLGTDSWLRVVSQIPSLEELSLNSCQPEVKDGLISLSQGLKNLKVLNCDNGCGWPLDYSAELKPFGQMPTLRELCLSFHDFDGGLMRALSSHLENLRSLSLAIPSNVGAEDVKYIAGMSSLEEFSLTCSDLDGSALKILSEGSCQLRKLHLIRCKGTTGEHMKHVAGMSSLRELTLADVNVGSRGMSYLAHGTFTLETLKVENCEVTVQDLALLLEKQQSLSHLRTWGCVTTVGDEFELANLKKRYPVLRDGYIF